MTELTDHIRKMESIVFGHFLFIITQDSYGRIKVQQSKEGVWKMQFCVWCNLKSSISFFILNYHIVWTQLINNFNGAWKKLAMNGNIENDVVLAGTMFSNI